MTSFPTGDPDRNGNAPAPGFPLRASHCRCDRPLLDSADGHCFRCGRHRKDTISHTWLTRAQSIRVAAAQKRERKTGRRRAS